MGIFSKKSVKCCECGREFEVRFPSNPYICDDCSLKKAEVEEPVSGYVQYARERGWPEYTIAQLKEIKKHRDAILEKYRMTNGISKDELREASDNYKKLSEDQAMSVLVRISNSSLGSTMGAAYTGLFFAPTRYDGTIVDGEDIFTVGYLTDFRSDVAGSEAIMCAVFTNDPYIPVFPLIYLGKLGTFEVTKSKSGRAGVANMFESLGTNFTYPVQELKQLKKQIKSEGTVRGNIEYETMMKLMNEALNLSGMFDSKHMTSMVPYLSSEMLDKHGYIASDEIDMILKMDKMFNRNFWEKQMKKLAAR